jgi:hypothetical protein
MFFNNEGGPLVGRAGHNMASRSCTSQWALPQRMQWLPKVMVRNLDRMASTSRFINAIADLSLVVAISFTNVDNLAAN